MDANSIASYLVDKFTIGGSVLIISILLIVIEWRFHKINSIKELLGFCVFDILIGLVVSVFLALILYNNGRHDVTTSSSENSGSGTTQVIVRYIEPSSQGTSSGSTTSTTISDSGQRTTTVSNPTQEQTKKTLTYISFSKHSFKKGQYFDVYSAPSTSSWHGTASSRNGVAYTSTNGDVYVAGSIGQWLLVKYKTNKGPYRMGYTRDAKGTFPGMTFDYYAGTILSNCSLTDGADSIQLRKGDSITVLGRMDDGIYIEAYVNGQQARGTIPEPCVSW